MNPSNQTSSTRRPTIGLFVENTSDIGQGYYPDILAGVAAAAQAQDINLHCFIGGVFHGLPNIPFDSQRNILYKIASLDNVDGLIIISALGNYAPKEETQKLYNHYAPLPTVTIGIPIEGTSNITIDHSKGMFDMLVHLIEVHHYRRIAFIRGPEDSLDAEIRYQVYQEVLAQYDIPFNPDLVAPGLFRFTSGVDAIRLLLDQRQVDFDVIVGANDHNALGALEELQARNIVVPYEVAVVGFDDIRQTQNVVPPLTTVKQPLFHMGKEAVNVLLAKMTHKAFSEQIILPTELVLRRSCGCLKIHTPSITSQADSKQVPNTSLTELLTTYRDDIITDLAQRVDFSALNGREGAQQLLDSFMDEVTGESNGRFLSTIDKFLRVVVKTGGDISSWQAVIAVLRHHIKLNIGDGKLWLPVSNLLYEAQVFIAGEIRNAEAQHFSHINLQNWLLHDIGQLLITTFDLEGLKNILASETSKLGIPGCYLAFYEEPQPYQYPQSPPEWSRLVLVCNENGRLPLPPNGVRFPTRQLLPKNFLPQNRRYSMMVEPLYFREEQIGLVLLERGPHEGNIYEVLRGQIASALKGALLLEAHKQAEAELRQHRDHLDELIKERTAELASTNNHLRQEIIDRHKAERKLAAYTAELERSNQELQDFAYVASHDLQEPLRKIQAFGDLLRQKYGSSLEERGQSYIARMQNAASRMQALIVALLEFSRVRTHKQPFAQVDLSQIVRQVLQDLEIATAEVNAEIKVTNLPTIEADALQMRQLFQNLLANALKFHRPNVPLKVKIEHQILNTVCEITVSDNGIGFDEKYAERIFNVFERLHDRDEYSGTGVGLAICRRIAERHGGDIYARSKPGEGATFTIRLLSTQPKEQYLNE